MSQHRQPQTIFQLMVVSLILLLPLSQHAGRYDPYEPHRVGVMALLTAALLPVMVRRHEAQITNPRHASPAPHPSSLVWLAVGGWVLALVISTVFALSPSRALVGDLIRRMGLLTHLLIISAALIGASLPKIGMSLAQVGRWFWLAGVICALVVILQSAGMLPNDYAPRAPGTIGVPTFAGGWLALAFLWGVMGLTPTASPLHDPQPQALKRVFYLLGLAFILLALVLTGSRGAALSLLIGAWVSGSVWAIFSRQRIWSLILLGLAIMTTIGGVLLTRLDWNASPLARLPLISRLNPSDDSASTIRSRELIWGGTLALMTTHPTWETLDGLPDAFAGLRLWVGYGLEAFETVFRPAMTPELREREDGRPVDRAHNDWLDTWVAAGVFGMIARGALWLSIGLFALRLARDTAVRREACLILAILVAHGVDLQFSFTTVVTGWSVWLGIGGLGALCYREHFQTQPLADGNNAVPTRTGIRRDAILRVRDLLYIGLLLLACMIWALDARADVLIQRALITPTAADAQAMMTDALHTRPWDDRQYTLAVFNQLQALETWSPDQSLIWLTQAAQFNPYDATTAFLFGVTWVEIANRTQAEGEYQAAVAQAERYFAAAVRLSPLEGSYWREYARLAYWQLNDAERATMLITRALKLAPDDFAAQGLKAQIDLLPLEG